MPNHIHFFCSPAKVPIEPIQKWVAYWKSLASREWPRPHEQPIWQRDFWDTQLRQHESYGSKWEYVVNNPLRAGLVKMANIALFKASSIPSVGNLEGAAPSAH